MQELLERKMAIPIRGAQETENAYYGFVPEFSDTGDIIARAEPRLRSPSNGTNQLWMTFYRYVNDPSGGDRRAKRHFQVCQLCNASYELNLEWNQGFQNATGSYTVLGEVSFPDDKPGKPSNMSQHAYSAFIWALTDQLVGSLGWFQSSNQTMPGIPPQFGVIDTPLQRTNLLGSDDLDFFFNLGEDHDPYKENVTTLLSDQRLEDKNRAKNRTLAALVEELSYNLTVSLMHNHLLT
jgi:hypothetical protein